MIYIDSLGYTWINTVTIVMDNQTPCFRCKRLTNRFDIIFDAAFCGSYRCNELINEDLAQEPLYENKCLNDVLFGHSSTKDLLDF